MLRPAAPRTGPGRAAKSTPDGAARDAAGMSTIDFDDALAPLEPKNTARLPLRGVKVNSAEDVILIGKHAGPLNAKFQSLSTKLAKKHAAILVGDPSPARKAVEDEMLRELLAKTVLTGWENVCDRDGKPVAFTVEQCMAFIAALQKKRADLAGQRGMIDSFFGTPTNFADGYSGDLEELGKG